MFCIKCRLELPGIARFCSACGEKVLSSIPELSELPPPVPQMTSDFNESTIKNKKFLFTDSALNKPLVNKEWRIHFLEVLLSGCDSEDLSEWLKQMGQPAKGTKDEKKDSIREKSKFISMDPEKFRDTASYLVVWFSNRYKVEFIQNICSKLELPIQGTKKLRIKRIIREVGYQEGWLDRYQTGAPITKNIVCQILEWSPLLETYNYEKDCYPDFYDEMVEIFSEENVHEQYPLAHGAQFKIDFHLGHPSNGGIGVEFKMPNNNSDIQKALGQLEFYEKCYKSNLIVVAYMHKVKQSDVVMFKDNLEMKEIYCVLID